MINKRVFSWILLTVLVLAMISPAAYAAGEEGSFIASDTIGMAGEIVEVTISIENNPGIISAALEISYDDNLVQLVNVEDAKLLNKPTFADSFEKNPYYVGWNDALATDNNDGNGVLVTLSFEIREDAISGTTPIAISFNPNNVFDWNLNNV